MHKKKLIAAATIVALTMTAAVTSVSVAQAADTTSYTKLPLNPSISAQKTDRGKTVADLAILNGELYTGYGDYNANTGPINVTSMNLSTKKFTNYLSMAGEEISNYRIVNGSLYAPNIDPRVAWTANTGYATNAGGKWVMKDVTPFIHVFDVTSSDGKDLWLAGSISEADGKTSAGGAIKRSVDGGKTWTIERVSKTTPALTGELDRYYWVEAVNGKIYTGPNTSTNGVTNPVEVWDKGVWSTITNNTDIPGPTSGIDTIVFKNKIVYNFGASISYIDTNLNTIVKGHQYLGLVKDLYVDGDFIYALSDQGLWKSSDGIKWGLITSTLPANTGLSSVAVDSVNKKIYLGGNKAEVFITDLTDKVTMPATINGIEPKTIVAGTTFDIMEGVTATDNIDGDVTGNITFDDQTFENNAPGTYEIYYFVSNSAGLYTTEKRIITVTPASTPSKPIIRNVDKVIVLEGNPTDVNYNVKAFDTIDGDITSKMKVVGTVDSSKVGEQTVTYTVTNSNNLTTAVNRTFLVLKKAPTIKGADNISIFKNETFDPKAGVTATDTFAGNMVDTFSGDVTDKIVITGTVDTATVGTYKVTYSVTNVINETTTVERVITVKESEPAKIVGATDKNVTINKTFDPKSGVTATDITDGVLTSKIVVTGKADTTKLGTYTIVYTVKNSNGLVTTVNRIITVVPNSAPIFKNNVSAILARNATYNAQTAVTVTDPDNDRITSFSYSSNVDTSKAGVYSTTYMVTDSAGQTATQKFDITVK
jgi:hypothetical protein